MWHGVMWPWHNDLKEAILRSEMEVASICKDMALPSKILFVSCLYDIYVSANIYYFLSDVDLQNDIPSWYKSEIIVFQAIWRLLTSFNASNQLEVPLPALWQSWNGSRSRSLYPSTYVGNIENQFFWKSDYDKWSFSFRLHKRRFCCRKWAIAENTNKWIWIRLLWHSMTDGLHWHQLCEAIDVIEHIFKRWQWIIF